MLRKWRQEKQNKKKIPSLKKIKNKKVETLYDKILKGVKLKLILKNKNIPHL